MTDAELLGEAVAEARAGLAEGGIPIGSVLVRGYSILGRGHKRRIQEGRVILHGEIDALENAGLPAASVYRLSSIYTTHVPCRICFGPNLLLRISRVIVSAHIHIC